MLVLYDVSVKGVKCRGVFYAFKAAINLFAVESLLSDLETSVGLNPIDVVRDVGEALWISLGASCRGSK